MSEDKLSWRRLLDYMRERRSLPLIAVTLVLGVALLLLGRDSGNAAAASSVAAVVTEERLDAEAELELRLEAICGRVSGVSSVSVMVTLESGLEKQYAQNYDGSSSEGREEQRREYVLYGSGGAQQPLPTTELMPRVRGVAVVCSGGDDPSVQLRLTSMLCALLDISAASVSVVGAGN